MTEHPKDKGSTDYKFINEEIVPKKKSKWMKRAGTLGFVICMAVVFGLVSKVVSLVSEEYLREWLGLEEKRQQVTFTKPSPSPGPTTAPRGTSTPVPTPTKSPLEILQQTPLPEITVMPEPTAVPEATVTPEPTRIVAKLTPGPESGTTSGADITGVPEDAPGADSTPNPSGEITPEPTEEPSRTEAMLSYLQMYQEISKLAEEASKSLVTVEAVEQGVDWFQEIYEKRTRTTGLVMFNDGVDLLILVGTEQISGASSILVYFNGEPVDGRIYSLDKEYGLAVVAVPLVNISEELIESIQMGELAAEETIYTGLPVLALGAPNGYEDSMEIGMITGTGRTVPVSDGEVTYFTTNIAEYDGSYGFVLGLDGKVLGMITHTLKENPTDGIFSAVALNSIQNVIEKLLNNEKQAYFGMKGQDVPANLKKEYELDGGVYISEVENASPALTAGIKAGDILIEINGEGIEGIRSFTKTILECSTREIIQVKLLRQTEDGLREMTVEVALTEKK